MSLMQISDPLDKPENEKKFVVGIDFGTTNSLVTKYSEGKFNFFKSDDVEIIPTVITITTDNKLTVGKNDNDKPNHMEISSIKRFIGLNDEEQKILSDKYNYNLTSKDNMTAFEFGGDKFSIIDVSSKIFAHLKKIAESQEGKSLYGAVITVPAYFNDTQRQAVKNAALLADIKVLRLINEPTSAAIAYGLESKKEGKHIVYDLGGGTFDVSVLALEKGIFRVLSTDGDTMLGGDDIDFLISEWLLKKHKVLKKLSSSLLKTHSKLLKEKFSMSHTQASINIAGCDVIINIDEFEEIISPVIKKTVDIVESAILESKVPILEIESIILVGGSSRINLIKRLLKNKFNCNILDDIDPDKVIAQGAAIQAEILSGNTKEDILLLDVLPLSLGIETMGNLSEKIIPRNTSIPITAKKTFTTFKDGQSKLLVHVIQGERELVSDCKSLGKIILENIPPMISGMPRIEVEFQIDADGILSVTATELNSKSIATTTIKPSFGLSEKEISTMISEANKTASKDKDARRLNESKIEAQRVIYALEQALTTDADELLSKIEYMDITKELDNLKVSLDSDDHEIIDNQIKNLENKSEFYVERRMNKSINSLITGRGVDDVL